MCEYDNFGIFRFSSAPLFIHASLTLTTMQSAWIFKNWTYPLFFPKRGGYAFLDYFGQQWLEALLWKEVPRDHPVIDEVLTLTQCRNSVGTTQ